MADITVQNLTKYYGDRLILKDISFDIQPGEKVAILGANGAGKTTLLNILTGRLSYDGGHVAFGQGRTAGVIDQMPDFPPESTVEDILRLAFKESDEVAAAMDALTDEMTRKPDDASLLKRYAQLETRLEILGGYNRDYEINRVCNGLEIAQEMRSQKFDLLSGGEKTRINLAHIILEQTDVLLLDEPTNHLDLHAIEWLEEYLASFKGTVVAISHDRYFLDRTITRVIEVLDGKAEFYSGNYSFYAVEKERRYLEKMRQYEKEQAKIAQLEKSAEQLRMFAFKGMDKTYRRALSMEKRIERMRTTDKPTKERALSAQFKSQEFYGDEVFALKKLKKSFGDRVLFHDVDLQVRGGERIALIGDNGTGKSTLIKMLMEEEYPDEGKIKFGPSVRIAYLPQIVEFDVPERNLVDTMLYSKRNITPQSARNRLAAFHFTGEDVFKSVSVLSGGELSRLKLCILMDEEVNLLILDEPTNHLDIASREWIEEAVESYDGTLLFVSHDRYFINRFATRVWELENGVITDYPMGFARYRQVKALEAQNKIDHTPKAVKEKTVTEKPKPNRSAQQARRQLTICEKEISTQETAIAEIEQRLEEAGGDYERYSEVYKEKEAAEQKLSELMEKWETLAEQAGE